VRERKWDQFQQMWKYNRQNQKPNIKNNQILRYLENNRKFTTQTIQTGINKEKLQNLRKYGRQNNTQQDL